MPISLSCQTCGRNLRVKDELAGMQIYCPDCKGVLYVPRADEALRAEVESPAEMTPAKSPDEDPYAERYQEATPSAKKLILPPAEDDNDWDDEPPSSRLTPTQRPRGSGLPSVLGGVGLIVLSIVLAVGGFAIGFICIKPVALLFIVGVVMVFKGLFSRE